MKSCPYCGKEYPDDVVICPLDQNSLEDPKKSPREAEKASAPGVICPQCGSDDCTFTIQPTRSFSWLAFLAGGIIGVMFRNAGRCRRVRCNRCEARFDFRSPHSKLALIIFWILVSPVIILLIIFLTNLLLACFSRK